MSPTETAQILRNIIRAPRPPTSTIREVILVMDIPFEKSSRGLIPAAFGITPGEEIPPGQVLSIPKEILVQLKNRCTEQIETDNEKARNKDLYGWPFKMMELLNKIPDICIEIIISQL